MKIYIDDPRVTLQEGWPPGETSREAIDLISAHQDQELYIAFDHDLGGDDETKVVPWFMPREGNHPSRWHHALQQWTRIHLATRRTVT